MNPDRPVKSALILILTGAVLGIGSNILHPHPLPWKPVKRTMATLEDEQAKAGTPSEAVNPGASGGTDDAADPAGEPSDTTPNASPGAATEQSPGSTPASESSQSVPSFKPMKDGFGGREAVPKTDLYSDIPESEYPVEVHTAKAKSLYDRGGLLVLDARDASEYADGHIKGAVEANADEVVGDLAWMEKTAADPRPILVYCDGGDCELSMDLGFAIAQAGHRRVLVYKDGYPAWKDAGYPVDTGDTP
jgi:rhodanese-related sulfurtransferase